MSAMISVGKNDVRFVFTPVCVVGKLHFIKLFVIIKISGIQHNDDIMSVSFKNNTTGVTSGAGTA